MAPRRSGPCRREGRSCQGGGWAPAFTHWPEQGEATSAPRTLVGTGWACKQASASSWGVVELPRLPPSSPAAILTHAVQEAHSPAADAGVGAVAHAAPGVAVVLKEAAGKERGVRVTESLEPTSSPRPTSPEHGSVRLIAGTQGQPQATGFSMEEAVAQGCKWYDHCDSHVQWSYPNPLGGAGHKGGPA